MKSCPKPVANFEFNSKSIRGYKCFRSKSYQGDNRQRCIDCLKPRSNKNESGCKKCGCN